MYEVVSTVHTTEYTIPDLTLGTHCPDYPIVLAAAAVVAVYPYGDCAALNSRNFILIYGRMHHIALLCTDMSILLVRNM